MQKKSKKNERKRFEGEQGRKKSADKKKGIKKEDGREERVGDTKRKGE